MRKFRQIAVLVPLTLLLAGLAADRLPAWLAGRLGVLQVALDQTLVARFGPLGGALVIIIVGLLICGLILVRGDGNPGSESTAAAADLPPAQSAGDEASPASSPVMAAIDDRLQAMRRRADAGDGADAPVESPADVPTSAPAAASPHAADTIVLVRRIRQGADDWADARSWFGGAPRLGSEPWPRDKAGLAQPFVAQINLAELAAASPDNPLPKNGALAFFLGSGCVVHVPAEELDCPPATPPADQRPATGPTGDPLPDTPSTGNRAQFPCWPVAAHALDLPAHLRDPRQEALSQDIWQAMDAAVSARFTRRQHNFSFGTLCAQWGAEAVPVWWHGVQTYVDQLRAAEAPARALQQRREADYRAACDRLDQLTVSAAPDAAALEAARRERDRREMLLREHEAALADLPDAITVLAQFSQGRDPWRMLSPGEADAFAGMIAEVRISLEDIVGAYADRDAGQLGTRTMRAMMAGDAAAFAALPPELRDLFNSDYRLPIGSPHQMFGLGTDIQGGIWERAGAVLLLQLVHDDMQDWRFGDNGAFQFWISPDDLAAGRWDRVELTFECH